jgi:peptidylprolyl isomerase
MPKRQTLPLLLAVLALGAAVAGCGSSTAPGVVLAPSAGATADSTTATTSSSTTTTTAAPSTSTTPLPSALKTEFSVPTGPPPKKVVVKDLIKGTGPAITSASQTVTVAYVGKVYKTGKVFDASWDHPGKAPLTDALTSLIPGWQTGMIGMKVGGRRELIIPPAEGYGATAQAKIPANSTLVFVIDLRSIS